MYDSRKQMPLVGTAHTYLIACVFRHPTHLHVRPITIETNRPVTWDVNKPKTETAALPSCQPQAVAVDHQPRRELAYTIGRRRNGAATSDTRSEPSLWTPPGRYCPSTHTRVSNDALAVCPHSPCPPPVEGVDIKLHIPVIRWTGLTAALSQTEPRHSSNRFGSTVRRTE